jgi:hypothetical protein
MDLTKESEVLMNFLLENNCVESIKHKQTTNVILTKFYKEIMQAYTYIETKKRGGGSFYKLKMKPIHTLTDLPKPTTFRNNAFPTEIMQHIHSSSSYHISYTFSLFEREIVLNFIVEDFSPETQIETYNDYVDKILVWLYIINEYSSKRCSKRLTVFLYFTTLKKNLPPTNIEILGYSHVNTAFTYTCPSNGNSEIIVYRKEEWFKVFMHETFHNFALDFSDMNADEVNKCIRSIFPVKSDVNLFEAYTEFWAEMMNCMFCSFYLMDDKNDLRLFLQSCEYFMNIDRSYRFFQMVKTLHFMGLTYKDLYSQLNASVMSRNTFYKEKSNVLAYYILTTVLLNNYQGFLSWCNTNNLAILQFKKTAPNLMKLCDFIKKNYKTVSFFRGIECGEKIFKKLHQKNGTKQKNKKVLLFLLKNMRMTSCEMG